MKWLALLGSGAILMAAVAQQDALITLPEPLAGDMAKLTDAKVLKVHFTKRIVGEPGKTFTLELGKDKKFKLTYDDGFILSDGASVYEYSKAKNSYSQKPMGDKELAKFRKRVEVFGWEGFMQMKPGSDLASATVGANKTIQGNEVQTVDVTVKPDNHTATIFIDPKTGVTSGFTTKIGDKDYLVIADKVELSTDRAPDAEFAFMAPTGATMAKEEEGGTFASVQALMNDNCMPCHSADHKRAGVDLSSYDGIAATVTSGQSSASLLVKAVKGDGVDLMPKGRGPLTSDQIASISKWIDAGAKNQ